MHDAHAIAQMAVLSMFQYSIALNSIKYHIRRIIQRSSKVRNEHEQLHFGTINFVQNFQMVNFKPLVHSTAYATLITKS